MTTVSKEIQDLLDEIAAKNNEKQRLEEAEEPSIGTFYWIDDPGKDELLYDREFVRQVAPNSSGIKDINRDDLWYWKHVPPKLDAKLAKKNFKYYPRGRVIYIVKSKEVEIRADKHILENDKILDEIKSEFRIPKNTKAAHSPPLLLSQMWRYFRRCLTMKLKEDHSFLGSRQS
jgi:hypothetical protein